MKIFIIEGTTGEAEDAFSWIVKADVSRERARAECLLANKEAALVAERLQCQMECSGEWAMVVPPDCRQLLTVDPDARISYPGTVYQLIERELVVDHSVDVPALVSLCQDILHQLSTDSDLDQIVGAAKYASLTHRLRGLLKIDSGRHGCSRCSSNLVDGYCVDESCPYSDWPQNVVVGDLQEMMTRDVETKYNVKKRV